MKKEECCPKFEPKRWDKKTLKWKEKHFIRESIPAFFHIPIFGWMIGQKITKMWELIKRNKTEPPLKDWLILFYDPHPFKSEILMGTQKPIKNADNISISGTLYAKVFDGPYNAIPKFIKEIEKDLAKKKLKAKKYFVHYAYCPKCAKKYKHNYMILFAKVKE
jgi:hypothetical protein